MRIALLEPYFTGSHAQWARQFQKHSSHEVKIFSLPGRYWKWRMHGGAIELSKQYLHALRNGEEFDLVIASDMLDLTVFLALTKATTPMALYFHENQFAYPWSERDRDILAGRDQHYGFINYVSALSSTVNFFNSQYNLESFLCNVERFLRSMRDYRCLETLTDLKERCRVLPLGMELQKPFELASFPSSPSNASPLILWNHRWEYDKNPEAFFQVLTRLSKEGSNFRLAVLGESFGQPEPLFEQAREDLKSHIVHWGYLENRDSYYQWLRSATLLPVTSNQDFFGISVIEATVAGAIPILPRRLSFPELIDDKEHPTLYYSSDEELYTVVKRFLSNPFYEPLTELSQELLRFDWKNLVEDYDACFQELCP